MRLHLLQSAKWTRIWKPFRRSIIAPQSEGNCYPIPVQLGRRALRHRKPAPPFFSEATDQHLSVLKSTSGPPRNLKKPLEHVFLSDGIFTALEEAGLEISD